MPVLSEILGGIQRGISSGAWDKTKALISYAMNMRQFTSLPVSSRQSCGNDIVADLNLGDVAGANRESSGGSFALSEFARLACMESLGAISFERTSTSG